MSSMQGQASKQSDLGAWDQANAQDWAGTQDLTCRPTPQTNPVQDVAGGLIPPLSSSLWDQKFGHCCPRTPAQEYGKVLTIIWGLIFVLTLLF